MPDYQAMYLLLFNAVTDALELLPGDHPARTVLVRAQQDCEELYIEDGEEKE